MCRRSQIKVLVKLFQKLGSPKAEPWSPSADGEIPFSKRFSRGEFYSSPVDCCKRGDALQVKASPPSTYYNVFLKTETAQRFYSFRLFFYRLFNFFAYLFLLKKSLICLFIVATSFSTAGANFSLV